MSRNVVQAVKRVCRCGGVIDGKVCSRCGPRRESRKRTINPYRHQWRKFRLQFLSDSPLCKDCEAAGRATFSTEPHHIKKVEDFPELMYEESNLIGLCHSCHSARTARGE